MSKHYFAIPNKKYDQSKFLKNVSKWYGVHYKQRSEEILYLWLENESTRGVDVTDEGNKIEIRTTILSNHPDYQLVNWIAFALYEEFDCEFIDEDDNALISPDIIDLSKTSSLISSDYNTVKILAMNGHELTVFGPHREVHIGNSIIDFVENFSEDAAEQLELKIRHIQYNIPKPSGNYLSIQTENGDKSLCLLKLDEPQIISKFDYLGININEEKIVLITNEDLKTILPFDWQLLDEYTIDATVLRSEDLTLFIQKAIVLDRYSEL